MNLTGRNSLPPFIFSICIEAIKLPVIIILGIVAMVFYVSATPLLFLSDWIDDQNDKYGDTPFLLKLFSKGLRLFILVLHLPVSVWISLYYKENKVSAIFREAKVLANW